MNQSSLIREVAFAPLQWVSQPGIVTCYGNCCILLEFSSVELSWKQSQSSKISLLSHTACTLCTKRYKYGCLQSIGSLNVFSSWPVVGWNWRSEDLRCGYPRTGEPRSQILEGCVALSCCDKTSLQATSVDVLSPTQVVCNLHCIHTKDGIHSRLCYPLASFIPSSL